MNKLKLVALVLCALLAGLASEAQAFTHVVAPGETLASIAERFYGRIQYEKVLVAANELHAEGGSPIVAGMRLEVPAVEYRRVKRGETWASLAAKLLGAESRADVFAIANGTSPWLPPEPGSQIVVPYNLRVLATSTDTIVGIAYKYLGNTNRAWVLDRYNSLKGRRLRRGDVVLVPLVELNLTEDGQRAAAAAAGATCSHAGGATRRMQRRVQAELPALVADVKSGRYVDAVTRGNRFLASGELSTPTLAIVHRQLLEAYVALNATGLATAACNAWRKADPNARLDPVMVSPKIIAVCDRGRRSDTHG